MQRNIRDILFYGPCKTCQSEWEGECLLIHKSSEIHGKKQTKYIHLKCQNDPGSLYTLAVSMWLFSHYWSKSPRLQCLYICLWVYYVFLANSAANNKQQIVRTSTSLFYQTWGKNRLEHCVLSLKPP